MAAKSAPDGYTLASIGSTHAVNAALNPKLPYAPAAGFNAIAMVATAPVTITANLSLPVKSLKDLIALAKTHPGRIRQLSARGNREVVTCGAGSEHQYDLQG